MGRGPVRHRIAGRKHVSILIANLRTFQPADFPAATIVYVGRRMGARPGSPLANRFRLTADTPDARRACLAQYWANLAAQPRTSPAWVELARLAGIAARGDLILCCFCTPAACHADVIRWQIETINRTSLFWRAWEGADESGRYALDERAAIYEFDAGRLRWEAEAGAAKEALCTLPTT